MPDSTPRPLFQRRHYDAIADVIRDLGCLTEFQRRNLATEMGYRIAHTNQRFNRERFITRATDTGRTDRAEYVPLVVSDPTATAVVPLCTYCNAPATHHCGDAPYVCGEHAMDCCTRIAS